MCIRDRISLLDIDNKYDRRGVSFDKKDVHDAIKNIDQGLYPNSFCKIIPDIINNDVEMCLVMHADGAGTKSSLAYAYWKETNDLSVWKGISQDSLIMNIDDLICCLLYTSPSPRDGLLSRMPSSA